MGTDEDRIQGRVLQLLEKEEKVIRECPVAMKLRGNARRETDEPAARNNPPECPFAADDLKELWETGLLQNNRYWVIRNSVESGPRRFPFQRGLKDSMAEDPSAAVA